MESTIDDDDDDETYEHHQDNSTTDLDLYDDLITEESHRDMKSYKEVRSSQ